MKTNLTYSQYNNTNNGNLLPHKHRAKTQELNKTTRENKEQLRPARAISFGGSASLNKGVKKAFNKTVEFVYENEAAYNAIYSWIVAGMLKPLFVLNMPGSEEKDKQIVATKNFLQAFIGGFLGLTIGGGFIKKAIDVVKTNLKLFKINDKNEIDVFKEDTTKVLEIAKDIVKDEHNSIKDKFKNASKQAQQEQGFKKVGKYLSTLFKDTDYEPTIDEVSAKAKELISNFIKNHQGAFEGEKSIEFLKQMKADAGNKSTYEDAFEVLWKNSTGAITAIGKAKISSLLLPSIMAFLFAKKNAQKEAQEKAKENILRNNSSFKAQQEQFQKMMNKNKNLGLSFKGNLLTSAIDGSARLIENMGMSSIGINLAKALSHAKKPSARMADIESFGITGYWFQNTARSKKIDPSQKLGLNVHSVLVTIVSSTAAFIIDWALDGIIDKSKGKYKERLEEIAKSVSSMKHGESLDKILANVSEKIKMGIKDEVTRVLDSKKTEELAKITQEDIDNIIKNLSATETFKGFDLKPELIKKVADSLEQSEPIRKQIKQACADMIGSEDIAKKLARSIGDSKAIEKTIESLTKTYGKKLSKFKSLTIFTLVVRFLVPVLMVPFSGKLKKKIIEWTNKKQTATAKTA